MENLNLHDAIDDILGEYEPTTYNQTLTYVDNEGTTQLLTNTMIPDGISGVDFSYVVACIIFLTILYIFWKTFVSLIKFAKKG